MISRIGCLYALKKLHLSVCQDILFISKQNNENENQKAIYIVQRLHFTVQVYCHRKEKQESESEDLRSAHKKKMHAKEDPGESYFISCKL